MEAQMHRPAHQHIEQEDAPHNIGLHSGESNQPGEKKSMMKKVKDKAKKIKDTIKKQGQGQEHEHRYDENQDEDDDDDEEIANDREIHGAPMHESTVISSTNVPMQPDQNLEKPTDTWGDRIDLMVKGEAKPRPNIPVQKRQEQEKPIENKIFPSPMKPLSVQRVEPKAGEPEVKLGPSMGLEEDPHSPKIRPGDAPVPPSNYESKVSDPSGDGGKEAGVTPLIRRLDNLNVGDESETKPESRTFTGSHVQFSPQPIPTQDEFTPESNPLNKLDNTETEPKNFGSNKTEGMPRDTVTGKFSSVTSALTDKAISAKNVVASKPGYGGEGMSPSNKPETESAPGYTQKITETLPVYEKVAGAGTAVLSRFQGGGSGQEGLNSSDKPESGSPPGYTQKITGTLKPVYEKVAGAGTAVLSRFQGGGSGQEGLNSSDKPESGSTPGYTQKITGTLNPVYEKVAGAGTAVMSKYQGSGEAGNQGGDVAAKGTDKGVSVKDYFSEKLRPGDEDKALSEKITDALHKKKEGYLQKIGEEKPMGKVTEWDEVATGLGTGLEGKREGEDALDAGRESSGSGVVGRVKDIVGSWIGKGTGTQTAQDSINESCVDKTDRS